MSENDAAQMVRRASSGRGASVASALDIALTDYHRRYGDVRFTVTGLRVSQQGALAFEVTAR